MIKHIDHVSADKFRVKFDHDILMNSDMSTIPAREYIETDGAWLVRATSARHLLAFAQKWQIPHPPELEEAARFNAHHDTLLVLPLMPKCIDLNHGVQLVFRLPERPNFKEREILGRLMNLRSAMDFGRVGMGWNYREGYWEMPVSYLGTRNINDVWTLVYDYGFMLTEPAVQLLQKVKVNR